MTPDPATMRPVPHHVVWTWQAPVAVWLGDEFRAHADATLPFLVIGEELTWPDAGLGVTSGLTPLHLMHGLALSGGEGPIPGDTSGRLAQRVAFDLLAQGIGRSREQALMDVACQLGEHLGEAARIRVLRNAPGLGIGGSLVSCALAFALFAHREHVPAERQPLLAHELLELVPRIVLDDLHPAAREHLHDVARLAREVLREADEGPAWGTEWNAAS